MAKEIKEEDFQEVIKNGIVLVDFAANWCAPCRAIAPVIDQMAQEADGYSVYKVNVDEFSGLGDLGIRSVPTFIVFKDGNEISRIGGSTSKSELLKLIEKAK